MGKRAESVEIRSASKAYGAVRALDDVSLNVGAGEFVSLLGPSGSGKTTLLGILGGFILPTSGTIHFGGRDVTWMPPHKRDIGMVFQNYALYAKMSVYDNMAFGLKMRKFGRDEIEKRVRQAAEILGIQPLLARRPRQLSGGQRQRVALGRAIVRHPRVFLFDEPLSNLDAKLRVQMRVELKRLHHRLETTAIYVTHDQVEAMTLGDRVVVMKDGVVQQVGEPLQLYGSPANRFVASFIGSPAMNFAEVTVTNSGEGLWAEAAGLRIRIPPSKADALRRHAGQKVVLGVRPEALGNEILLDVRAGSHPLVARVDPATRVKVHDSVRLALDPERVHFFDAKTEAAI